MNLQPDLIPSSPLAQVGLVAIGRNEGERLRRCLASLPTDLGSIVYVDSGSSDDSVSCAHSHGAEVVELDMSVPFTAARARNAGLQRLVQKNPQIAYVQFIDGDCEIAANWLEAAATELNAHSDLVAVCGWRRERHPERTPYNCLCDVEWRMGPVGETKAFGGDAMIRVNTLVQIGGYDPTVIAAEDDELSIRLRQTGGRIVRLDRNSTVHDAEMTRLGQWWNRAKRCGHGYAHLFHLHGAPPEGYFRSQVRSALVWAALFPALVLGCAIPTSGLSLLLLGIYPLQKARITRHLRQRGFSRRESVLWGLSCAASKFPEFVGMVTYLKRHLFKRAITIIEYK